MSKISYPYMNKRKWTAGKNSGGPFLKKHIQKMLKGCSGFVQTCAKVDSKFLQVHKHTVLLCDLDNVGIPETVQIGLCDADILMA